MLPVWRAHHPCCLGAGQAINVVSSRGRRGHVPLTALRALDTPFPTALGLPQADTEVVLLERLRSLGGDAQRGVQLLSYTQARGPGGSMVPRALSFVGGLLPGRALLLSSPASSIHARVQTLP
jgi:hypothetical protein